MFFHLPPPTILIVDDHAVFLDHVASRLMRRGFAVTTADSVVSATNALERFLPDLLLLDDHLGNGTARDVLQSAAMLAHHAADNFRPIVVWSSEVESESIQSLDRDGLVSEILNKSIDERALLSTLARHVVAPEALILNENQAPF